MKVRLLFFALLYLLPVFAFAGTTGKIAGVVRDASTGDPLPGVNIQVEGTVLGTATDVDGVYYILKVPPGEHSVTAQITGYTIVTQKEVIVKIDQTTPLDFELAVEVVAGQEVTVTAERPPVELDLTGTKHTMSSEDISHSWVKSLNEALLIQPGTNVHGGIRGGFGVEDRYFLDGLSLRDNVSNANFGTVNVTSIGDMEVLTSGWNAEYGQATGTIVNILTKTATDRIHGTFRVRHLPSGLYHWGRNIYSKENYEWRVMGTLDYWTENDGGPSWADKTPQERLDAWVNFISGDYVRQKLQEIGADPNIGSHIYDYEDKSSMEYEGTLYGPITRNLGFMVTGKYLKKAPIYPGYLEFNEDWNFQGKLDFQLNNSNRFELTAIVQGFNNTEGSRLHYWSSEDAFIASFWGQPPLIANGYENFKHWPFSTSNIFELPTAPEFMDVYGGQLKFTHVFNPSTFLDLHVGYQNLKVNRDNFDLLPESVYKRVNGIVPDSTWGATFLDEDIPSNPLFFLPPIFHRRNPAIFLVAVKSEALTFKADWTQQLNPKHQFKAGVMFSPQKVGKRFQGGDEPGALYNNLGAPTDFNPWDFAAYAQDKFEVKGMVVNFGLRFDAFKSNKKVGPDIFNPLMLNHPDYDNYDPDRPNGVILYREDVNGVTAGAKSVFSPRLGISHPITELTVLHFSYGHFNQRPSWQLIGGNPSFFSQADGNGIPDISPGPDGNDFPGFYLTNTNSANTDLTFERIIQYEVGFQQQIPNLAHINLVAFYKDGKNLTSLGVSSGRPEFSQILDGFGNNPSFGLDGSAHVITRGLPSNPNGVVPGGGWQRVTTNSGHVEIRGLEANIQTLLFRNITFNFGYTFSFLQGGRVGYSVLYATDPETGEPLLPNSLWDVSLSDRGISGNDNQQWNPHNSLKFTISASTPREYGLLLGDWNANFYYSWAQGHTYTYHSPDDFSTEPNNRRWASLNTSSLRLAKAIPFLGSYSATLAVDILNVFNQKRPRYPTISSELAVYEQTGKLPVVSVTGEENVWSEFDRYNTRRQVWFGLQLDF